MGHSWRERDQLVRTKNRPDIVNNSKNNDSGYRRNGWERHLEGESRGFSDFSKVNVAKTGTKKRKDSKKMSKNLNLKSP